MANSIPSQFTSFEYEHSSLSNDSSLIVPLEYPVVDISYRRAPSFLDTHVPLQATFILLCCAFQCMSLHPTFSKSSWARSVRVAVAPITVFWLLRCPFYHAKSPPENFIGPNMGLGVNCIYLALKSIEWALRSSPVYERALCNVNGVQQWLKAELSPEQKKLQEESKCSIPQLIGWTFKHLTSMRGLEFDWGPGMVAKQRTITSLLVRIYKIRVVCLCAMAFSAATRDSPERKPAAVLRSIGVPEFYGLDLFAESLLNICMGIYMSGNTDCLYAALVIATTVLHKILSFFNAPLSIKEYFNPIYYPLMFDSPHLSESLTVFWGKRWHSNYKRIFLVGGKSAYSTAKALGASPKVQQVFGLFGVYFVSAFLHEYIIWVIAQPPHYNPHIILKSFPGSGLFFMLQPLGILLEPHIIPYIPRRLGGGRLWTIVFLSLSAYTFRKQYFSPGRMDSSYPRLSDWSLRHFLVPFTA